MKVQAAGAWPIFNEGLPDNARHTSVCWHVILNARRSQILVSLACSRTLHSKITVSRSTDSRCAAPHSCANSSYPIETIRRRMQVGNVVGDHAGIVETAQRILRKRGASGFYIRLTIGYRKSVHGDDKFLCL
jgi:hypothetical protein